MGGGIVLVKGVVGNWEYVCVYGVDLLRRQGRCFLEYHGSK